MYLIYLERMAFLVGELEKLDRPRKRKRRILDSEKPNYMKRVRCVTPSSSYILIDPTLTSTYIFALVQGSTPPNRYRTIPFGFSQALPNG